MITAKKSDSATWHEEWDQSRARCQSLTKSESRNNVQIWLETKFYKTSIYLIISIYHGDLRDIVSLSICPLSQTSEQQW